MKRPRGGLELSWKLIGCQPEEEIRICRPLRSGTSVTRRKMSATAPKGPAASPQRLSHFIIDSNCHPVFIFLSAQERESGERIRVTQNQYCAFRWDRYIRDGNSLKCSFVTLRGFERGDGGVGILKNHDSFFFFLCKL